MSKEVITCTRRLEWDAMHRIPRHENKCRAFHGHRYAAEVTCIADELDPCGRIVDFSVIKKKVGAWIDRNWDHTGLFQRGDEEAAAVAEANIRLGRPAYWMEHPPTAENIAAELARVANELLTDTGVSVVHVRLWETPNCYADWHRG